MASYALKMIMLFGIVAVVTGLMLEINNWRRGRRIVTRLQQFIRLATGFLLVILFGMILAGGPSTHQNPFAYLLYWMSCFVIGVLIIILMLLDLREIGKIFKQQHREMMQRLREEAKRK